MIRVFTIFPFNWQHTQEGGRHGSHKREREREGKKGIKRGIEEFFKRKEGSSPCDPEGQGI